MTPVVSRALLVLALVWISVAPTPACEVEGRDLKDPFNNTVQHARALPADFLHIRLDLSFDWKTERMFGKATHRLRSIRDDFRSVTLDGIRMTFKSVVDGDGNELVHRDFDDRIEIDFAKPMKKGEEGTLVIEYECAPEMGIYFISPIEGYPDRRQQIWAQGETYESRHWYPCFDSPAERVTSEVVVTIPDHLKALSNGELISDKKNGDGTRTVHWSQKKNHVNYLITLAIGDFETIHDEWDGIPMAFWYEPGDKEMAELSFKGTADMMKFFSECFGRYPWVKYDQIVVKDFHFGGMENTTATVLTHRTLHKAKDEPNTSSRGLVAHEIAHQWFGDLVTCRDWAHIWLNESFATFCDALYTEHALGRPDAQIQRLGARESYMNEDKNRYRRPLMCRTYKEANSMFDRHSYPKGSVILEMLRQHLGAERFYNACKFYLKRHEFDVVETPQLQRALEDATGESLAWFFDQWIYRGGHPTLKVRQSYDAESGKLTLDVNQTHRIDRVTPLYRLPVEVAIFSDGEPQIEEITVTKKQQTFTFTVDKRPRFVRFDRRSVLLCELDYEKSRREWTAQLETDPDTLGRVFAARALGKILEQTDDERVASTLAERLSKESFWGVRRAIANALKKGGDGIVESALSRALTSESDPRVREVCAQALGARRADSAWSSLVTAFESDRSDWVRSASLKALHDIDEDKSWDLALSAFKVSSHRERIRNAAIEILEKLKRDEGYSHLIAAAAPGQPRASRVRAIEALGRIGRGNDDVIQALIAQVDAPQRWTRRHVLEALGRVGGDEARLALEGQRRREQREDMRGRVDNALAALDTPETVDQLAEELKELRKKNLSLERRVEEIENKEEKSADRASF